jgi:hypothetical protein
LMGKIKSAESKWFGSARDRIERGDEDSTPYQSIIMHFYPDYLTMSCVFRYLSVNPIEPIAFELIKNSPDFNVPYGIK